MTKIVKGIMPATQMNPAKQIGQALRHSYKFVLILSKKTKTLKYTKI